MHICGYPLFILGAARFHEKNQLSFTASIFIHPENFNNYRQLRFHGQPSSCWMWKIELLCRQFISGKVEKHARKRTLANSPYSVKTWDWRFCNYLFDFSFYAWKRIIQIQ